MTSITRLMPAMALVFALACGASAPPATVPSPESGDSAPQIAAGISRDTPTAGSTNRIDKEKQAGLQTTANAPSEKKEQGPGTSDASTPGHTPKEAATSQPPLVSANHGSLPSPDTGVSGIGPISDEQVVMELRRAGISTSGWDTNFKLRSVDYDDILAGGPGKDGIPSIDAPIFQTVTEADGWLDGREPVQVVHIDGDARAYPMQIMMWHEVVNDTVGGEPVVITY